MDKVFVIATSKCGYIALRFVTADSILDIKRHMLIHEINEFHASIEDALEQCDVFLPSLKNYQRTTVIDSMPDEWVELLFNYYYTGGQGEQSSSSVKDWTTVKIEQVPSTTTEVVAIGHIEPNPRLREWLAKIARD